MALIRNIISGCLLLSVCWLPAQNQGDFDLLQTAFFPTKNIKLVDKYQESKSNPNEIQAVLSGLFLTYKALISSQDQTRCNFTPSCSEYGLLAVKKLGIIKGGISTLDRMTRCNGMNRENYEFDLQTLLLRDPVKW